MMTKAIFHFEGSPVTSKIEIENPTIIPTDGKAVDFEWENFIQDPLELEWINRAKPHSYFRAEIVKISYSHQVTQVIIALHRQSLPATSINLWG